MRSGCVGVGAAWDVDGKIKAEIVVSAADENVEATVIESRNILDRTRLRMKNSVAVCVPQGPVETHTRRRSVCEYRDEMADELLHGRD